MHDMEWLTHWLNTWKHEIQQKLKTKKNIVDVCVVDESAALIGACVAAFTQDKTTPQYTERCMNVLLYKKGDLPKCFVRIDSSHFVKSVHKNLRKGFSKTLRLLRGVMGYLIKCSNVKDFEQIMGNVFTLIRNEFVSPDVNKAKEKLEQLVSTHKLSGGELNDDMNDDLNHDNFLEKNEPEERIDLSSYKDTCNYRWVMRIYNSVKLSTEKKTENVYHSPALEKYLIHSFVRCPLWSNIMTNEFESSNHQATSAAVENEFKTIKKLLGTTKRRVDLAVKNHLEYLSGQMKLGTARQTFRNSQRPRSNSLEIYEPSEPSEPSAKKMRRRKNAD